MLRAALDEIRASVMDALGLELGLHAWGLLFDALTVSQLKQTLIRKKPPLRARSRNSRAA